MINAGDFFMTLNRNKERIKAMIILYQIYLYRKNKIEYQKENIINENIEQNEDFVNNLVNGVLDKEKELDNIANKYLKNWNLSRLGLTDQAIIKISLYELLYTDTPPKVCIDEAIELAKEYSDDKVVGMINAILDKAYHNNKKENYNEKK